MTRVVRTSDLALIQEWATKFAGLLIRFLADLGYEVPDPKEMGCCGEGCCDSKSA